MDSQFFALTKITAFVRNPANYTMQFMDFEVAGLASTKLRILDAVSDDETELAMWRVELGDQQSPGCYFHTQILGQSDVPPFPHSVCIPRLPTLFATQHRPTMFGHVDEPWYHMPMPSRPHGFVTGMSQHGPVICFNRMRGLSATNTL